MSEWKEFVLGDLVTKITKGTTPTKGKGFVDYDGINYIKSDAIEYDGTIDQSKFVLIDDETHEKFKRSQLEEGDILFSMAGNYLGKSGIVTKEMLPANTNQALAIIRLNQKFALPQFIGYCFRQPKMIRYVNSMSAQSAQPNINFQEIASLFISLPEIDKQKQIINVLGNLDQKITLLREQNQTLEELAQTLFKRWFVEFEFPNENGEPYKSSGGNMVESELGEIPEGWELHPLEDLVKVHNGYSYKGSELQESNVAMVTLKNFDRNGGFRFDGFKELVSDRYKEKHVVDVGDLVVAHTDLTQDAEVLGNPALIMKNEKYTELVISMDLVKVESKHKSLNTEFLYYLMRDKRFKYHCKGYANGTTVLHLSKSAIPEYLFPFPKDMTLIEDFGEYAYSVYQKISNNIEEIQPLTLLRDTLLPKLMSGELRVK